MGAVLYPSAWDRAVASARHWQVGKFSLRLKERSAELANGVGMPAQLETFADVLIFVGCPEDLGGASDDLVGAMVESQKASVAFSALMQVRNKVTGAFEEVMRMPL